MNCPLCEHELTALTAFLAATHVGTQCPACKVRLRNLRLPLVLEPRDQVEPQAQPRRKVA